jgi:hypothetical protein
LFALTLLELKLRTFKVSVRVSEFQFWEFQSVWILRILDISEFQSLRVSEFQSFRVLIFRVSVSSFGPKVLPAEISDQISTPRVNNLMNYHICKWYFKWETNKRETRNFETSISEWRHLQMRYKTSKTLKLQNLRIQSFENTKLWNSSTWKFKTWKLWNSETLEKLWKFQTWNSETLKLWKFQTWKLKKNVESFEFSEK